MSHRFRRPASVAAAASVLVLAALAGAAPTFAHTGHEVGPYVLEVGWLYEPTYVAQPNAVQVTITTHADGKPVLDLAADDLAVVVSTAGVDSPSLTFEPAFDAEEQEGSLGEYDAALVPTAPGDYSFHITGSIHGTAVDLTVASGEETFDAVIASTDLEFPAKMPTLTEVGTRLDRIDARIADLQSAAPGSDGDAVAQQLADLEATVGDARAAADAANRNALLGFIVGVVGIVLALWAWRARRAA
ncbi:MAG TPA: hypothetical protein VFI15_05730 [Candidatus Limnocylindrales bacterium]|nr:hypothetical protein [Candidatus Limnocylindrales bacterium]